MSLNHRIILSATLVLVIFISLTALALERAFSDSAESALHDKMTSQLFALMAAAEVGDEGLIMPTDELDALLGLPSSGVYAFITSKTGDVLWQSSSVLGARPPPQVALGRGEKRTSKTSNSNGYYLTLAYNNTKAFDKALATGEQGLGIAGDNAFNLHFEIGRAYEGLGEAKKACDHYKSVTGGPNVEAAKYQAETVLKCK